MYFFVLMSILECLAECTVLLIRSYVGSYV